MNIPIDISAVLKEATDVEAARAMPLCVSVLLDETAPADLIAFVRSSFASASAQARVSVNYFIDGNAAYDPRSDMAVIAAGTTAQVADIAQRIRNNGIPVMVVTTLPELVRDIAQLEGVEIPEADIVAPVIKDGGVVMLSQPITVSSNDGHDAEASSLQEPFSLEPYAIDEGIKQQLSEKMGKWIVAAFKAKRLAFAQAFTFVRRPLSLESVKQTSMQNAGVGLVVFIPGADMPIMTLNQAKMVLQIAAAYGQPLTAERAKELAAVVGGAFALRTVARQIVGVVPALGWAVKAAIGYSGTLAMGHAAVEYFEHGGNAAGVLGVVSEARAAAVEAAEGTVAGRTVMQTAENLGNQAKAAAVQRAKDGVKAAPGKIMRGVGAVAHAAGAAFEEAKKQTGQK